MRTIFYSWQSDLPNNENRSFIQKCLDKAIKELNKSEEYQLELSLDKDTQGEPGTPDIVNTIFEKIASCSVFIADVSIISLIGEGRKTPNPNVLVELGYAAGIIGWNNIICIANTAYGQEEYLPFDIRSKRILTYSYRREVGKNIGEKPTEDLKKKLMTAIKSIKANDIKNSYETWFGLEKEISVESIINNDFNFNAFAFGKKLEHIWFANKDIYGKEEFAKLIAIPPNKLEDYFKGVKLPDLSLILRITKIFGLEADFFFKHTSNNLRGPFWHEDIIKFSILNLVNPPQNIRDIDDNKGKFYSRIIFDLARNICALYRWLYDLEKLPTGLTMQFRDLESSISSTELSELKTQMEHQYYKLLEQYPEYEKNGSKTEAVIRRWFFTSGEGIARIVIEAIKSIDISKPEHPEITYYFYEDLKSKKVTMRGYDEKKLCMKQ